MKGILIENAGELQRRIAFDLPKPTRTTSQAVIEVHYGGLNYADLMMCNGTYPHPKGYPLAAGIEFSGVIVDCGDSNANFNVGDRVAGFSENAGAFSEYISIGENSIVKLKDDISLEEGAAYFVQTTTAYHLLKTIGQVKKNDIVLIHAIGGGVGLNLTQIAKHFGATVIGTVGTTGKEIKAYDCGADLVIDRSKHNFIEEIETRYGKNPISLLIDSTGAQILDDSFQLMENLGHVVSYGEASGKPYENLWSQLVKKSLTFSRLHIGHIDPCSKGWKEAQNFIQEKLVTEELKLYIDSIYDMNECHLAYEKLESRTVSGKVLIKIK